MSTIASSSTRDITADSAELIIDTIVYAVSGHGTIVSNGGKDRQEMKAGDYALIPAYAEHQEANEGDEEVVWAIFRSPGGTPIVCNLEEWGSS